MGNENSTVLDENTVPQTLKRRDLSSVAKLIREGKATRIVVLTGAGISTAAGIPDFRSPETGLYHNLARLDLPYAEAVFEISYFKQNPAPFYILAKELYPGKFHPTISHVFIALLASKNLLRMLFTQNIDCLERAAGVPGSRIVEAHGSFATQRCVECKEPYPDKDMREHVEKGEAPRCSAGCGGLVKPDIVFFGEQLPESFYHNRTVAAEADLMLILGTSLSVHPFASLPNLTETHTPRVLFNQERVGNIGSQADDVLYLGDCDSGIRELAKELGWEDDLEKLWRGVVGDEEAEKQLERSGKPSVAKIEEVVAEVDQHLKTVDSSTVRDRETQWKAVWEDDTGDKLASQMSDKLKLSGEQEDGATAEHGASTKSSAATVQDNTKSNQNEKTLIEAVTTSQGIEADPSTAIDTKHTSTSPTVPVSSEAEAEAVKADSEAHEPASFTKPVTLQEGTKKSTPEGESGSVL